MKKKIHNKKLLKNIVIGTMSLAVSAATTFSIANKMIQNNKQNSSSKNIVLSAKAVISGVPAYDTRPENETPENIYILDRAQEPKSQQDLAFVSKFYTGLINLGITDSDITLEFAEKTKDLLASFIPGLIGQGDTRAKASTAMSFYRDPVEIQKTFGKIHSFGGSNNEIKIFNPKKVFNIFHAQTNASIKQFDETQKYQNKVIYKVGSINLDALKDQEKILRLTIGDLSDPNNKDHDYQLIINNKKNKFYNSIDSGAKGQKLKSAFDNSSIMIRDMLETYDSSTPMNSISNVILDYKEFNKTKNIGIYIKPTSKNIDAKTAMTIKMRDSETQKFVKTGVLDVNLAPLYQPFNFDNKTPYEFIANDKVDKIFIHANATSQNDVNNKKESTFYMAENTKINFPLSYNDSSDAFENNINSIDLSFDGTQVASATNRINLKKTETPPSMAEFTWTYELVTIAGETFAKVVVRTDGQEIKIKSNNEITIPGDGEKRIFVDIPGNGATPSYSGAKNSGAVQFNVSNDTTNLYLEYIGNTYGNWMGKKYVDQLKPQWVLTDQKDDKQFGSKRIFDFEYTYYQEEKNNGIIGPYSKNSKLIDEQYTISKAKKLLILHDKTTGEAIIKSGKIQTEVSSGSNIAHLLLEYYSRYYKWTQDVFNDKPGKNKDDFYDPPHQGIGGWIIKNMLTSGGPAPLTGKYFTKRAQALVQLAYNGFGSLVPAEQKYITSLDTPGDPLYNNLGINVKTELENKLGAGHKAKTPPDWTDPKVLRANHLLMLLLERGLVSAIQEIMANETKTFEIIRSALLGRSMNLFLKDTSQNLNAISKDALKLVDDKLLSKTFKGAGVLTLNGSPIASASDGKEQLKSLLDFIYNFGLHNKYLSSSQSTNFDQYYKSGIFLDPDSYIDKAKKQQIGAKIGIIDHIINKVLNDDKIENIESIINKMQTGTYVDAEASKHIGKALSSIIGRITSKNNTAFTYKVLSTSATSSYIENLVIGKNLSIILNKWVEANPEKKPDDIADLRSRRMYDPQTVSNLAVSVGYYNIKFFIKALTEEKYIPKTIDELFDSEFDKNIRFEIPKTNSFIKSLSNPHQITSFGMLGIGAFMSVIGLSILLLSFKQRALTSGTKKSQLIIKLSSIAIMILGFAVAGLGFILPPF